MKDTVSIIGKGRLAEVISREWSGFDYFEVVSLTDFSADVRITAQLIVVAYDEEHSPDYSETEEALGQTGIPWLRGFISFGEGFVGPLVRPGMAGCSQCADHRRLLAGRPPEENSDLLTPGSTSGSRSPSIPGLRHMAHLLLEETRNVLQGGGARLQEHMYIVNLETLQSSLHFFLPDPLCPACGSLPDDSSEGARISLQRRPKLEPNSYRCRPLEDLKGSIGPYRDSRMGLINEKAFDYGSPFASVRMSLPSFALGNEVTAGRSHSFAQSELTAALEALERNCGQGPRGKRTVVRDSFNNLGNQALDPVKAGVYSKEQYTLPDFPYEPFDPDALTDWVWGYSLLQERSILVPETLAYYSSDFGGGFVKESSNGCAIGGSLEEAIVYGILEVAERDSFLMTWYAKLPLPRLDPSSSGDMELQLMIERMRAVAGYEVHLFNMTMEHGIPGIWALAKSGSPGRINLMCAAGAHLDPVRAAKSAVHELAGMLFQLQGPFEELRDEMEQMVQEPSQVTNMMHHVLLYGLPQTEERLHFLLDPHRPLRTFDEEFGGTVTAPHPDLTDDLKDLLRLFRQLNLDVIAVDQSSPETVRSGLHCVKVLIPGMLPMTFGHHLTRLTGLDRVYSVPVKLGYAERLLTKEQLNPHPHPFI